MKKAKHNKPVNNTLMRSNDPLYDAIYIQFIEQKYSNHYEWRLDLSTTLHTKNSYIKAIVSALFIVIILHYTFLWFY